MKKMLSNFYTKQNISIEVTGIHFTISQVQIYTSKSALFADFVLFFIH